ncbi:MAG: PIN domain-containing protein [Acidobacteria bacterium]|nr:PIN domain-containing protein [Acidobacteriota bacterium]MBI3656079.1 PIN domain-containing protein [Acidobacteriota bacterium]
MPARFVIDTHALLWYLTADPRLGPQARSALQNPDHEIIIPAIVLAEALFIVEHGKSPAAIAHLWDFVLRSRNVTFYPLDLSVLKKTEALKNIPEMHDRQIVGTILVLQETHAELVLLTKDERITQSGLVKTAW